MEKIYQIFDTLRNYLRTCFFKISAYFPEIIGCLSDFGTCYRGFRKNGGFFTGFFEFFFVDNQFRPGLKSVKVNRLRKLADSQKGV